MRYPQHWAPLYVMLYIVSMFINVWLCLCLWGSVEVDRSSCVPSAPSPTELVEDFEGKLSPLWQSLSGGQIGDGCGSISEGKALYFSSLGRREARTTPLDTTNTRSVPRHCWTLAKNQALDLHATPAVCFTFSACVCFLPNSCRTLCFLLLHSLVQFYIRIGGKNMGSACTRPRSRNEGECCGVQLLICSAL